MFFEHFIDSLPFRHLSIYHAIEVCFFPWLCVLVILATCKTVSIPKPVISVLVAFSAGSILAESILHSLPMLFPGALQHEHHHEHDSHDHGHITVGHHHGHSHESFPNGYLIIAGIIGFYAFQRFIVTTLSAFQQEERFQTSSTKPTPQPSPQQQPTSQTSQSITILAIIGDLVHNFSDGLQISIGHSTSARLGYRISTAIAIHEFVRTLSDVSILMQHGNFSLTSAVFVQLITFSATLVGSLFGDFFGSQHQYLPPISFGLSFYLAISLLQSMDDGGEGDGHSHGHGHGHSHGHSHSHSPKAHVYDHSGEFKGDQQQPPTSAWSRLFSNHASLFLDVLFLCLGVYSTELVSLFE